MAISIKVFREPDDLYPFVYIQLMDGETQILCGRTTKDAVPLLKAMVKRLELGCRAIEFCKQSAADYTVGIGSDMDSFLKDVEELEKGARWQS